MIKLKNYFLVIFTIMIMLCLVNGISVSASEYDAIICDDYGALTDEEENELTQYLYECSQEARVNIAVVITDETNNNGVMDYADVYEENLFGINSNSILYLINMNDNYDWLSCSGTAIDYYPQSTIDYILSSTSGTYLSADNMDFYGAITKFGDLTINQQHLPTSYGVIIAISFVISLVISLIICGIIASRYKFHSTTSANTYVKSNSGGVVFTKREDKFIKTHTTKIPRSQDNNTSTHTSSGGGTHSGGGFQR